jgi:hypothetical protein
MPVYMYKPVVTLGDYFWWSLPPHSPLMKPVSSKIHNSDDKEGSSSSEIDKYIFCSVYFVV